MMKARWIFTALLAVSLSATGFAQQPKVGERAPEIALEKVVSPPSALAPTMAGLRGKVVVMEFWGLWCGYCKQSIPHLNQLADKFGPRGVEFISISSDHEKLIREFLEKTKMSGTVALDVDSSVFDSYGITYYPTTDIIGRDGRILAVTHPSMIDEATMEDALANRPLRLQDEKAAVSTKPAPKPLFEVWVRPTTFDALRGGYGPYGVTLGEAVSPKVCLAWAYGVPESRILLETPLPDKKYDIKAVGSEKDKNALPALQLALASALEITATREEREIDVNVLAPIPGQSHKLRNPGPERAEVGLGPDSVSGSNSSLNMLLTFLDRRAGIPVVDETGLLGKYTYELTVEGKDEESLRKAVREQTGLDLRKERRTLPVVVVRKT